MLNQCLPVASQESSVAMMYQVLVLGPLSLDQILL
jgi:hypothetical protein